MPWEEEWREEVAAGFEPATHGIEMSHRPMRPAGTQQHAPILSCGGCVSRRSRDRSGQQKQIFSRSRQTVRSEAELKP